MATLIPIAVNPSGPGFAQPTAADTVSLPGAVLLGSFTPGSVLFVGAASMLTQDNANLFWDDANNSLGVGTAAPGTTNLNVVQPVRTTGSPTAVKVTGGAHTTLTVAETTDVWLSLARAVTFTTGGGTVAAQRAVRIDAPTYAAGAATTLTDAATVDITGAPVKSTNVTVTRAHALRIEAGAVSTAAASYGLTVNAQTGASDNYCAVFLGGRTGFGLVNPNAWVEVLLPAGSGGNTDTMFITNGARTGVDADTEINTLLITTATRQWNQGGAAFALQREVGITQPTYAFTSADTITLAATLHVGGAPAASTNATLTATHGIYVAAGAVGAGSTAAYGLTVNAPTGGVANYCAAFVGGNVGMGTTATAPSDILDVSGVRIPGVFTAMLDPTGFLVPGAATGYAEAAAVLSFTNTGPDRTFTITGNHTVYVNGVRYAKTTASIQIANTTGLHWIYYDKVTLVLTETLGSPTTPFSQVLIATVYWQASTARGFLADERHGITMDSRTHEYLHDTVGTRYEPSGLSGTFQTGAPQLSITKGIIWDEDIEINIPTGAGPTTTCRSLYLDPVTAPGWFYDVADAAAPYRMSGNFMLYNNPAAGTPYALTASGANQYVVTWIYATPRVANGIMSVIGQAASSSVAAARTANTPESLNFGTLPTAEMKLLYRVIWQNNGSATPTYVETLDYRNVTNLPGSTTAITAHGALSGLANDDHTQYLLLAGRGGQTITDYLTLTEPAAAAGSPVALTVTGGAHTTLAASTEATDVYINLARTVQWATGDFALQRAVRVAAPTYAFVGASTVDEAIAVVINGAPVAGSNATLKGSTALWVRTAGVIGSSGAVDASYGLVVQAMTGATANYCAKFLGGPSGFGTVSTSTFLTVREDVRTTGSPSALVVTTAKHTTLTAATEARGVYFDFTPEVEFTAGAPIALQRAIAVQGPTYKFTGASTITDAATLALTGAPIAKNGPATITRTHGILVQSVDVTAGGVGVVDYSFGLYVNAMTLATSGNYAAALMGGHVGIGIATPDAATLVVAQANASSGATGGLRVDGGVMTTQTATAEINFVYINSKGRQWAAGAIATQREVDLVQPVYAMDGGGGTITDAATLAVEGAPKADTGATITAAHGILVQSADVTAAGACTAAYGLTVNAPTGATNNAAAQFVGAHGTQSVVVLIQETAESTGATAALAVLGAAKTGVTATTEVAFVTIQPSTRQWATGAVSFQREVKITQPTYSFVGASIITDAATFCVEGAPKSDTNATITNSHGIYVRSADVTAAGAVPNSYGLTVNAMSGATLNHCAQFMGGNVGFGTSSPSFLVTTYIAGTTPKIAILVDSEPIGGVVSALQDSHVVALKSQSHVHNGGENDHWGMIYLDAQATAYAGQPAFRVRDAIDTSTPSSAGTLLALGRPTSTVCALLLNDSAREGDRCVVMPAAKVTGTMNGDDLYVTGGDGLGADHHAGDLYLESGGATVTASVGNVHIASLYAGVAVNICKSDALLGFFGTTAIVRNATPFTLNSGATSYDLPSGGSTLDIEKCLRQLLLLLGDTAGYGLANVTA